MIVHYVWIGDNPLPQSYINNLNHCINLNPTLEHKLWDNNTCEEILKEYNLFNYWSTLPTLISKCCMVRYIILDKFGGIYSDLDIRWRKSFQYILSKFRPDVNLLLTHNLYSLMTVNEQQVHVLDDPFIYSKQGVLKPCVEYCQTRTKILNDGDLYMSTGELKPHKLEPVGPFGVTEWIHTFNIEYETFPQSGYLDQFGGEYGIHAQNTNWK